MEIVLAQTKVRDKDLPNLKNMYYSNKQANKKPDIDIYILFKIRIPNLLARLLSLAEIRFPRSFAEVRYRR